MNLYTIYYCFTSSQSVERKRDIKADTISKALLILDEKLYYDYRVGRIIINKGLGLKPRKG